MRCWGISENGMITRVGAKGSVNAPRTASRVDLTGKTITAWVYVESTTTEIYLQIQARDGSSTTT